MHESLIVETGHDEDRVGFVLAQLHHSVVRVLGKLASAHAGHVPLEVLAQSLTTEDDTQHPRTATYKLGISEHKRHIQVVKLGNRQEPVTKSAFNPTLAHTQGKLFADACGDYFSPYKSSSLYALL